MGTCSFQNYLKSEINIEADACDERMASANHRRHIGSLCSTEGESANYTALIGLRPWEVSTVIAFQQGATSEMSMIDMISK